MGRLSNKTYKDLYDDISLSPNPDYLQEKYGKDPLTLISLFRKWVKGKHGFDLSRLTQYEDEHHEPLLDCLYKQHTELMEDELAANEKNYALLFRTFYKRDAQERKRILDYEKERRKRPDVKLELDDYWKERRKRPDVKNMRARQAREYYQDPEARKATKEKRKVYSSQQAQRNRERGKVISNIIKRMYKGQAYIVQFSKESGVNHKSLRKIAIGYIECRLGDLEKSVEFMIRKGEDVMPIVRLLEDMKLEEVSDGIRSMSKVKYFQEYADEGELGNALIRLAVKAGYTGESEQIITLTLKLQEYSSRKFYEGLGNHHFWPFEVHHLLDGISPPNMKFAEFMISYFEEERNLDVSEAREKLQKLEKKSRSSSGGH